MARDNIFSVLQMLHIPAAYSHFKTQQTPPYIVYLGAGQNVDRADNTHYWSENVYQVEYYFREKDEAAEAAVEDAFLDGGYQFSKSEDVYIESEDVFVIYYQVS